MTFQGMPLKQIVYIFQSSSCCVTDFATESEWQARGKETKIGKHLRINHTGKLTQAAVETGGLTFIYHPGFFMKQGTYILKKKLLRADDFHLSFKGSLYIVVSE